MNISKVAVFIATAYMVYKSSLWYNPVVTNGKELVNLKGYTVPAEVANRMVVVLSLITNGLPAKKACACSGIRWKDFDWLKTHHPEWSQKIETAQADYLQLHLKNIADAATTRQRVRRIREPIKDRETGIVTYKETMVIDEVPGDWRASAFLLSRNDPENFGEHIDVSGSIATVDLTKLVADTARAIAERGAVPDIIEAEYTEDGEEE